MLKGRRMAWLLGLAVLVTAGPAWGQQEGTDRGRGERQRGRPERPDREGGRMPEFMQVIRRLPVHLGLTPEQQEQYQGIIEKFRERWADERGQRDEMRDLGRQYREAQEAGDEARAAELREKMRSLASGRTEAVNGFLDEVETILTDEQVVKLDEFRQEMQRRAGGEERGLRELIRRLPEELEFTPEQQAEYDRLIEEQRQAIAGLRELHEKLQPLYAELREAMRAGDEARAAEIQKQIEEQRPARPDPQALMKKIEALLTAEQKAELEVLKAEAAGETPGEKGPGADLRRVLGMAGRLDLTAAQQAQLKGIRRDAMVAARETRGNREAMDALGAKVKEQIIKILDANQVNEFNRLLERSDGRGGERNRDRAGEGPRGVGGGRPRAERARGGGF